MSFDQASVMVDGGLSSVGVWVAILASAVLLVFLGLGLSRLVASVVPVRLRPFLAVVFGLALPPVSGSMLVSLSSVVASVTSLSITRICFMPTRHLLRDLLPGLLALVFTVVRVISSRHARPAV